jgi:hypothetical protein
MGYILFWGVCNHLSMLLIGEKEKHAVFLLPVLNIIDYFLNLEIAMAKFVKFMHFT